MVGWNVDGEGVVLVKEGNCKACENELLKLYIDVNGFGQFWVGYHLVFMKIRNNL